MTPHEEGELKQLLWIAVQKQKCAAKTKFYSPEAAQIQRGKHSKRTPPKLYTYICDWCGFYHLTSKRPMHQHDEKRAA